MAAPLREISPLVARLCQSQALGTGNAVLSHPRWAVAESNARFYARRIRRKIEEPMTRHPSGVLLIVAAVLTALAASAAPVAAQVPEIRLARQFSMGYLQFNVMEHQQLIEKHARALGIPEVKVSWLTFNGPAAVNDALLSGQIDIATGGTPGLLLLWSKTKGTPNEVRGISAMSSQPFLLNTRNPAIKTVTDLKDTDRIAVPAVKVSIQAIMLQMAAVK